MLYHKNTVTKIDYKEPFKVPFWVENTLLIHLFFHITRDLKFAFKNPAIPLGSFDLVQSFHELWISFFNDGVFDCSLLELLA